MISHHVHNHQHRREDLEERVVWQSHPLSFSEMPRVPTWSISQHTIPNHDERFDEWNESLVGGKSQQNLQSLKAISQIDSFIYSCSMTIRTLMIGLWMKPTSITNTTWNNEWKPTRIGSYNWDLYERKKGKDTDESLILDNHHTPSCEGRNWIQTWMWDGESEPVPLHTEQILVRLYCKMRCEIPVNNSFIDIEKERMIGGACETLWGV